MSVFLNHLTLGTGHLRASPRAEVHPDTMAQLRPWLDHALRTREFAAVPVPDLSCYTCQFTAEKGALLGTVYRPEADSELDHDPLVTFAVAPHAEQGALLWSLLGQQFTQQMGTLAKPAEPWCAAVLHPALALHPPKPLCTPFWLGDFERCVAWVWIDRASH